MRAPRGQLPPPRTGLAVQGTQAALPLLGLFALLISAGCGADADSEEEGPPKNQGLSTWCGSAPCDWTVDEGHVHKTSTWHPKDLAVSLDGPGDTQISQSKGKLRSPCVRFEVTAKADRDAALSLHLDFNDDGKFDKDQELPGNWRNVPFLVPTPAIYDRVRYVLRKVGDGSAQIAHVVVTEVDDCPSFPGYLRVGSRCAEDSVCESGRCLNAVCQPDEAVSQPTESE